MNMSTELAKQDENVALAISGDVGAMFGDQGFQMPVDAPIPEIKILREVTQFELPGGDLKKEFIGNIVHWHNANQYWKTSFEDRGPEDSPVPNCLSSDGFKADELDSEEYDKQSILCSDCPQNQFGSAANGDGKACQNTIRMYVLLDGHVVPCLLKAPPTSLGKKEGLTPFLTNVPNMCKDLGLSYMKGNAEQYIYQGLKIKFTLYNKDFSSGMSASLVRLELVGSSSQEDLVKIGKLTQSLRADYITKVAEHMVKEVDAVEVGKEEGDDAPF
jgi:hypothetical protein